MKTRFVGSAVLVLLSLWGNSVSGAVQVTMGSASVYSFAEDYDGNTEVDYSDVTPFFPIESAYSDPSSLADVGNFTVAYTSYLTSNLGNVATININTVYTRLGEGGYIARSAGEFTFVLSETVQYSITGSHAATVEDNLFSTITQLRDAISHNRFYEEQEALTGDRASLSETFYLDEEAQGNNHYLIGNRTGILGPGIYTFYSQSTIWDYDADTEGSGESSGNVRLTLTSNQPVDSVPEPASLLTLSGLALCFGLGRRWRSWRRRSP